MRKNKLLIQTSLISCFSLCLGIIIYANLQSNLFLFYLLILLLITFNIYIYSFLLGHINKIKYQINRIFYDNFSLEDQNDDFEKLIDKIDQISQKIKNDRIEFNKISKVRTEFLANVSHELKTPIFAIKGFTETLLDGAIEDTKVNKKFIKNI